MSTIGARLKEERKRLGLNQTDFATAGGVQKRAQVSYEQEERAPTTEYLDLLRQIGVDVVYVLTGELGSAALSKEETEVINGFRSLDPRGKAGVLALISGMNPIQPAPQNVFHGGVGQVVQSDITAPQTFNFGESKKGKK